MQKKAIQAWRMEGGGGEKKNKETKISIASVPILFLSTC